MFVFSIFLCYNILKNKSKHKGLSQLKRKITAFLLCIALCIVSFAGCNPSNPPESAETGKEKELNFTAMDTYVTIKADCSEEILKKAQKAIEDYAAEIDCMNDSPVSKLNNGEEVAGSETLIEAVNDAIMYATITDLAYNPCYYDLKKLWNIGSDDFKVPSDADIEKALKTADCSKLSVSSDKITLGGAKLDLGGIGKGTATQKAVEVLRENGVKSAILTVGGSVAVVGKKDTGAWTVAVQDPRGENGESLGTFSLYNNYISTSGDYQQYSEVDGKRYCHIFGKNGYPVDNGLTSVTVVCKDGTQADALSTALFVMGEKKALKFASENSDVDIMLVTSDKRIIVTRKMNKYFKLTNDSYKLTVYTEQATTTVNE